MSKTPRRHAPATRRSPVAVATVPPLYGYGLRFFTLFAMAALVAFWPSYFSRLSSQPTYHPHAHGLTMSLWVALLIGQAWLIRKGERPTHRQVGLLSYVTVPALVLAALNFLHFRVRGAAELGDGGLYFVTLVVNALVAFLVLFGLAMWHRKQPAVHARYMIATVFPLFTPVTDRLIGRYVPSVVGLVPRIGGSPVVPTAGFLVADAILVGLSIWDWRTNKRLVFPVALGVVLAYHVSVLTFYQFPWWQAFGAWFVRLPLS
jgi:uncharacterized membrane protein YozB (DUF420 family)